MTVQALLVDLIVLLAAVMMLRRWLPRQRLQRGWALALCRLPPLRARGQALLAQLQQVEAGGTGCAAGGCSACGGCAPRRKADAGRP